MLLSTTRRDTLSGTGSAASIMVTEFGSPWRMSTSRVPSSNPYAAMAGWPTRSRPASSSMRTSLGSGVNISCASSERVTEKKRLVIAFLAISFSFVLFRALPGDAVSNISRVPNMPPEAREALRAEFGLEPGPALRELEQRILHHDPELDVVAAVECGSCRSRTVGAWRGISSVA